MKKTTHIDMKKKNEKNFIQAESFLNKNNGNNLEFDFNDILIMSPLGSSLLSYDVADKTVCDINQKENIIFWGKQDKNIIIKQDPPQKEKEKNYSCNFEGCEKKYLNNSRLKLHQRTHIGLKPFKCDICLKTFNEKGNLKIHQRIHTGEKPYKCNYEGCEKNYKTSGHLADHIKRHLNIKPFRCVICYSSFARKNTLKTHMNVHTGNKPYHCEFSGCGRKFTEKGNMKAHLKKHKNIRSETCELENNEKLFNLDLNLRSQEESYLYYQRMKLDSHSGRSFVNIIPCQGETLTFEKNYENKYAKSEKVNKRSEINPNEEELANIFENDSFSKNCFLIKFLICMKSMKF